MELEKPRHWTHFLLVNCGVPASFWVIFQLAGPKPAIGFAVGATALQLALQKIVGSPISPIFLIASFYTIGFGLLDFIVAQPHFYRLVPSIENLTLGCLFLGSVVLGRPILAWFEKSLPAGLRKNSELLGKPYFMKSTSVWGAYFLLKSALFLHAALIMSLDRLIVFRAAVGGPTLAVMAGIEIVVRKRKYAQLAREGTQIE